MADPQLVCLSLIHPPEFQSFSQIHAILWRVFLPEMQLLGLAMEGDHSPPEPRQIVHQIRQVAGDETIKMFTFMIQVEKVANRYIKLLNDSPEFKGSRKLVNDVCISAFGATRDAETMQQGFAKIREELDSGIRQITGLLTDGNRDALTGINEPVAKLFNATDELNGLFQECRDYFEEAMKQTSDETSIETNRPSQAETQMMQEKWGAFREQMGEVTSGWKNLADLIKGRLIIQDGETRYAPEARLTPTSDSSPQMDASEGTPMPDSTRPKDHSEISTSGPRPTTITPDPSPTKPKTSFWRKIFRRSKRVNTAGTDKPIDRHGTAPAPSVSSPEHKSKPPFWRKLIRYLRRNNSSHPESDSEAPTHPGAAAVTSSNACDNPRMEMNNPASSMRDLNHEAATNAPSALPMSKSNPT